MRNRWASRLVVLAAVSVLTLAACNNNGSSSTGSPTSGSSTGGPTAGQQVNVGLALPGPTDDHGFNQGHFDGATSFTKANGWKLSVQNNLATPEQIVAALRSLAATNNVVIAAGGQFADPLTTVAPQFPKVQFILTAGFAQGANISSVLKNWAEQSYVAGVVAAKLTNAKKMGFIGGIQIPPTTQAAAGFAAGVKATDPSVQVLSVNIGTFNDPAKAKEAGSAQIASGADVIQGFVDAAEPGLTTAVTDAGKDITVIAGGHDPSECALSKEVELVTPAQTSTQVIAALTAFKDGTIGSVVNVSLSTLNPTDLKAAVQLCPGHEDTQLQNLIDQTVKGIVDGSIKVPTE